MFLTNFGILLNANTYNYRFLCFFITLLCVLSVTRPSAYHTHVFSPPIVCVFYVLRPVILPRHRYLGGHVCSLKRTSLDSGVFARFSDLSSCACLPLFTLQSARERLTMPRATSFMLPVYCLAAFVAFLFVGWWCLLALSYLCRFRHGNAGPGARSSGEYVRVFPETSCVWYRCACRWATGTVRHVPHGRHCSSRWITIEGHSAYISVQTIQDCLATVEQ